MNHHIQRIVIAVITLLSVVCVQTSRSILAFPMLAFQDKQADDAAKQIEKKYGKKSLIMDDVDWGILQGRMSALSWVMGVGRNYGYVNHA
jgi:hypothetical protein